MRYPSLGATLPGPLHVARDGANVTVLRVHWSGVTRNELVPSMSRRALVLLDRYKRSANSPHVKRLGRGRLGCDVRPTVKLTAPVTSVPQPLQSPSGRPPRISFRLSGRP